MTILGWWRWLYREHRLRWHILLSVALIVGMFAVVNGIAVIDKANGAERICTHNPDGSCKWSPRKMSRKFKAGYFHHAHGVSHLFTPKAHRYVVKRTASRLKHAPKAKFNAIRRHQNAVTHFIQSRTGRTSDAQRMYCESGSYMCVSKMSWEDVTARGKCVGHGYYTTHRDTCKWGGIHPLPPSGPVTLDQWQALGGLTLCGIGLVAGIAAEAPTAGAATIVVANVAATCLFSFWAATN
jgi:hypothetical protein